MRVSSIITLRAPSATSVPKGPGRRAKVGDTSTQSLVGRPRSRATVYKGIRNLALLLWRRPEKLVSLALRVFLGAPTFTYLYFLSFVLN